MMNTQISSQVDLALQVFRLLPRHIKNKTSVSQVRGILNFKLHFYAQLPYLEKCSLTTEDLSFLVSQRLKKLGVKAGRNLVRQILKAEEVSYLSFAGVLEEWD